MKRITLTKESLDHSDSGQFSFSFFCDICGKEWLSPKKPFTGGICNRVENDEALRLLWGNEHRAAFDEAHVEAHTQFNRCPKCNSFVCDECFNFGDVEYIGLCKNCGWDTEECPRNLNRASVSERRFPSWLHGFSRIRNLKFNLFVLIREICG